MNPQEEHWMVTLQVVFYPALAIVGIPSNIVTFLIFWRRNCLLSKSSTFYLMAISVADTLVLIFIVVLEITVKFYQEEPFWSREPWCHLRDIFSYGAYNTSTWLVVVFTAERFIAIHTWAIKTKLCTRRSALAAITTILLLSHLLAIPYYWSNVSVYDHNQTKWACIYEPEAPHGYVHALVGAQTLVAYVLPFLIILTLNGLTLRQISLSNRVHVLTAADLTSGAYRVTPLLRSRKRKSVVLLVTVSMSFVLLSVTRAITQIIIRTFFYGQDRNDYNLQINVAADIGSMLSLSNAAINTYLYACTQAKFRQVFITCVRQVLSHCKTNKTLPSSRPAIYHL
ncbi:probable G-protein coupled receptor 139 isoform X1 [Oncorhynchus clarkii lewisi]|uniref:probable G-protein coupled receptor 139 isoform X1 n=1 Tax=Oncorhynchus clarkii lewisi TaxID=490388 RepID=UPI0039B9A7BB